MPQGAAVSYRHVFISSMLAHDLSRSCETQQVLRFYAVWDDRQMLSGDRRPYVVHYYLEDDTMEVLETLHDHNSGRDQFPKFLRRARLLKVDLHCGSPTLRCDLTLLLSMPHCTTIPTQCLRHVACGRGACQGHLPAFS